MGNKILDAGAGVKKNRRSNIFLWASLLLILPIILKGFLGQFDLLNDSFFLFEGLAFIYFAWAARAGIKQDEFTTRVTSQGLRFGAIAILALGILGHFLLPPYSPTWYILTGFSYAGFLVFSIGVVYSWWNLR